MSTIEQRQREILSDFALLEDAFDQYSYLVELSCRLPEMDAEYRTDGNKVTGCQSALWLHCEKDSEERFFFQADSDTLIMKGILYLMQYVLNGQPCSEVMSADLHFLQEAAITGTFESARKIGIGYIVKEIKQSASMLNRDEET